MHQATGGHFSSPKPTMRPLLVPVLGVEPSIPCVSDKCRNRLARQVCATPRSPVIHRPGGLHGMPVQMFPCQSSWGTHGRFTEESNPARSWLEATCGSYVKQSASGGSRTHTPYTDTGISFRHVSHSVTDAWGGQRDSNPHRSSEHRITTCCITYLPWPPRVLAPAVGVEPTHFRLTVGRSAY